MIPQNSPFGTTRAVVGRQAPTVQPLVVDGKRIDVISELYAGNPVNMGAAAHELSHLMMGTDDMYFGGTSVPTFPFQAGTYSIMDASYGTMHFDAFHKLKAGWLNYTVAVGTGEYALRDVETSQEALVLYDPRRGPREYFLLENRWRGSSYDAGVSGVGGGIPANGIALWHVLEDPALFPLVKPSLGSGANNWGRNGVLLMRANGGAPVDDTQALHNTRKTLTDNSTPVKLPWIDGAKSGIKVELLTVAGGEMRLKVTMPVGARLHSSTSSSVVGNFTRIDDPYLNGNPDALVLVSPNWNPPGTSGAYHDHPIGVFYETSVGKWAVFNQDHATMPVGASFNYRLEMASPRGSRVHVATEGNIVSNTTRVDHPAANGNKNAIVHVTANWNPPGSPGVYNDHNIGVWYDASAGRWAVFNQDLYDMPGGAAFNVRVGGGFVHKAATANTVLNYTYLESSALNGNPGASILVTPNWNPGGQGGVYVDHPVGVWYDASQKKWAVFNQDGAPMPPGAAFNVIVN